MTSIDVTTSEAGVPIYFALDGQIWLVGPQPVRWFERVAWWETKTRMSARDPGSRIDVEVWQLQAHPAAGEPEDLVTFEAVRDGSEWTVRARTAGRQGMTGQPYGDTP
ncbi:MAG TPA: hypothetical protein VF885_18095 [Arthrobacter sp.]